MGDKNKQPGVASENNPIKEAGGTYNYLLQHVNPDAGKQVTEQLFPNLNTSQQKELDDYIPEQNEQYDPIYLEEQRRAKKREIQNRTLRDFKVNRVNQNEALDSHLDQQADQEVKKYYPNLSETDYKLTKEDIRKELRAKAENQFQEAIIGKANSINDAHFKRLVGFDELQGATHPYKSEGSQGPVFSSGLNTSFFELPSDIKDANGNIIKRKGDPSPDFKKRVIELAGIHATPERMREAAHAIVNNRVAEFENGPNEMGKAMQAYFDYAYNSNTPGAFKGAQIVGEGVRGLADLAGFVATPAVWLGEGVRNEFTGDKDRSMGEVYGEMTQNLNKKVPEVRASNENVLNTETLKNDPLGYVDQAFNEAIKSGAKYVLPALLTGGNKSWVEALVSGVKGEAKNKALQTAAAETIGAYGGKSLAKTVANKAAQSIYDLTKSLDGSYAVKYLDNVINTGLAAAPQTYASYYDDMIKKGYDPKEAADKAAQRTGVNILTESLVNPFGKIRIAGSKLPTKILGEEVPRTFSNKVNELASKYAGAGKDALLGGLEEFSGSIADSYQDFIDGKEKGAIPQNATFDWGKAFEQAGHEGLVGTISEGAMSTIGGHGVLPSDPQSAAINQGLSDLPKFKSIVASQVENGKISSTKAGKIIGFMDRIAPHVDAAIEKGMSPEIAVKYVVEGERLKETAQKLIEERGKPEIDVNTLQDLQNKVLQSQHALVQLAEGTYIKGRTVSGEEMTDLSSKFTPASNLQPEQARQIVNNGPYTSKKINVSAYANDPEIAELVDLQKHGGIPFDDGKEITTFQPKNSNPVVLGIEGGIVDGKKRIAWALAHGITEIEAAVPIEAKEMAGMTKTERDHTLGTAEIKSGQLTVNTELAQSARNAYDAVINNPDLEDQAGLFDVKDKDEVKPAMAVYAAAQTLLDDGISPKEASQNLPNIVGQDLSPTMAEWYVNQAQTSGARVVVPTDEEAEVDPKSLRLLAASLSPETYRSGEINSEISDVLPLSETSNDAEAAQPTFNGESASGQSEKSSGNNNESLGKEESPKIRTVRKRGKPTIVSPLYKKAIAFDTNDPFDRVLQYFIGGGKISPTSISELFNKGNKRADSEHNARISLLKKDAPTISRLAHSLWEDHPSWDERATDQDYKDAIEQVLLGHNSRTSMANDLVSRYSEEAQSFTPAESEMQGFYDGSTALMSQFGEDTVEEAATILSLLSPEQIDLVIAEEEQLLMEAYSSDDYVNSLIEQYSEPNAKPALKSIEQVTLESQLTTAKQDLTAANKALEAKRSELDKGIVEDQENLFGERKSNTGDRLFDERVNVEQREKTLSPLKNRVDKAQQEVSRLQNKLAEAASASTSQLNIEESDSQVKRFADKLNSIADRIDNSTSGNAYTSILPISPKILSASLRIVARAIKQGIKIAEAIKLGLKHIGRNHEGEFDDNVYSQFVIDSLDLEGAIKEEAQRDAATMNKVKAFDKIGISQNALASSINVIADAIESGESTNQAISAGIRHIKDNFEDSFNQQEYTKLIKHYFKSPAKTSVKASIEKATIEQERRTITVDEYAALKEQLRREAKSALAGFRLGTEQGMEKGFIKGLLKGKREENKAAKGFANRISDILGTWEANGRVSAKQTLLIANKAANIGSSEARLLDFLSFVDKVLIDADYQDKLNTANNIRAKIRKQVSGDIKNKLANNVASVKMFLNINPSKAENISEYNDIAKKVLETITQAKAEVIGGRGIVTNPDYAITNESMDDYTAQQMEYAEKNAKSRLALMYDDLVSIGAIDPEVMSFSEMRKMLDAINSDNQNAAEEYLIEQSKNEEKLRALREVVSYQMMGLRDFSEDPLNSFTSEERNVLDLMLSIDTSRLDARQLAKLNDVINNVITNHSFTGSGDMATLSKVQKDNTELGKKIKDSGITLGQLKNKIVRYTVEGVASINLLHEIIAKDTKLAAEIQRLTGISDIFNGNAKAKHLQDLAITDYLKLKKGLGKEVDSPENVFRRGVYARVIQFYSTDNEQAEFERTKGLIQQSAKRLMGSSEKREQREGKLIDNVYNELLEGSNNASEVRRKMASINKDNLEIVEFWQRKFNDRLQQTAESTEIYNNRLFEDVNNYTATRLKGFDNNAGVAEGSDRDMFEQIYFAKKVDNKSAGTKVKRETFNILPKNSVLDLDFDAVQARKYLETNYDVETSKAIAQVRMFFDSSESVKLLDGAANKRMIQDAIRQAVLNQKGHTPPIGKFEQAAETLSSKMQGKGVRIALGSLSQLPKQYISVAVNTLGNLGIDAPLYFKALGAGTNLDLFNHFNIGQRGETKAGYNRRADLDKVDRVDFSGDIQHILNNIDEKASGIAELTLKALVTSDVAVARTSWLAYYMQDLKRQGVEIDAIDWSKAHISPNQEAAAYAEQMTSRNQNPNDVSSMPEVFKNKRGFKAAAVNIFAPFSTFSTNARVRMTNDVQKILFGGNKQEATKSLLITAVEVAAFNAIKIYALGYLTTEGAQWLAGLFGFWDDEDNEKANATEWEKRNKQMAAAAFNDYFLGGIGTIPQAGADAFLNYVYKSVRNASDNSTGNPNEEIFYQPSTITKGFDTRALGMYGIVPAQVGDLYRKGKVGLTGQTDMVTEGGYESMVQFDRVDVTPEERAAHTVAAAIDLLTISGLSDAEVTTLNLKFKNLMQRKMNQRYGGEEIKYREGRGQ